MKVCLTSNIIFYQRWSSIKDKVGEGYLTFPKGCCQKKYYTDGEIVPISSDTPTIGPGSKHLDSEYCQFF